MPRPWNEIGRYGGVGIDLVLAIVLLGAFGHWLDERYWPGHDTAMIVGGILGAVVGFRNLFVAARRIQRDIEAAEAKDPEAGRWKVDENWLHETSAAAARQEALPQPGEPTKDSSPPKDPTE